MSMMLRYITRGSVFLLVLLVIGCTLDKSNDGLSKDLDVRKEIATGIRMFYTDSAITQFRLIAPVRESYYEEKKLIEEYPQGVNIEFYDDEGAVTSSMVAKNATRIGADGIMTMKDSVVMLNERGDALKTTGIVWNEGENTLETSKFVQLIQAESQDTFYGIGFRAVGDFSRFTITDLIGKRQFEDLDDSGPP